METETPVICLSVAALVSLICGVLMHFRGCKLGLCDGGKPLYRKNLHIFCWLFSLGSWMQESVESLGFFKGQGWIALYRIVFLRIVQQGLVSR